MMLRTNVVLPPTVGGAGQPHSGQRSHTGPRQRPRDRRATARTRTTREQVESTPPLRQSMTGRYRLWAQRWRASRLPGAASGQRDLRPCRHGHADLQDAILVVGLDLLQLCPGGQPETAIEPAVAGLALVVVFVLDRGLCFALAADHQVAVVHGELDVAFLHPRQLGLDDQRALVLENVGLGLEGGAQSRPAAHVPFDGPTVEELGEQVTAQAAAHQPLARLPVLIEELGEQVAAYETAYEALARLLVLVEQLGEHPTAEAPAHDALARLFILVGEFGEHATAQAPLYGVLEYVLSGELFAAVAQGRFDLGGLVCDGHR